jgi:hypothetical protein
VVTTTDTLNPTEAIMAKVLKVFVVCSVVGLIIGLTERELTASAADIPVTVTSPDAEFDAVFVPADYKEPVIVAGDSLGERAF